MARKLSASEAIDLATSEQPEPGVYVVERFVGDVDYCDSSREAWIWSIGRDASGCVLAATDTRFYQNPDFECLWLR
jgi:hypothetical protein